MILKFRAIGCSITEIAQRLGRNKATVSRKLQRNSINGEYIPAVAEELYQERRMKCRRHKILENPETFEYVKDKFLNHQWSPEEIQGRLKLERASMQINYVTIYRAIYSGVFNEPGLSHGNRGDVRKLRHHGKSRHAKGYVERRGQIQISHEIDERPASADKRSRLGDWEGDTVAGVTGKACIVTLVDRKSR